MLLGSGFLAVYVAGIVLGHGSMSYRSGLVKFHDAIAWLAQVTTFLVLGLPVLPSRLLAGDHVYVFSAEEDRALIELLFAAHEED